MKIKKSFFFFLSIKTIKTKVKSSEVKIIRSIVNEVIKTISNHFFFFTKKFWAYKNTSQAKTNQQIKNKQTKKTKVTFLPAKKLLRGWKPFVCVLVLFVCSKFFRKKKKSKLVRNCLDNFIYYTTDVYPSQPAY